MLIGYSMPTVTAVGITGGTWLTADGGAACCDGRPARKARFQWTAGTSTSSYVAIALSFAAAAPLRVLAALGLTVPVGVRLEFLGPGGASLGGSTGDARTVRMPDGTTGVWAVGNDDGIADGSCSVRIYNDCNGSTWANSSTVVDVGELVAMPAVEIPIDVGWTMATLDPTESERSRSSQLNAVMRSAYRQMSCTFSMQPTGVAAVREGGLANGMDWLKLTAALTGKRRCAAVAQFKTVDRVNTTALYGVAVEIGETQQVRGQFYRQPMVFQEIPGA